MPAKFIFLVFMVLLVKISVNVVSCSSGAHPERKPHLQHHQDVSEVSFENKKLNSLQDFQKGYRNHIFRWSRDCLNLSVAFVPEIGPVAMASYKIARALQPKKKTRNMNDAIICNNHWEKFCVS